SGSAPLRRHPVRDRLQQLSDAHGRRSRGCAEGGRLAPDHRSRRDGQDRGRQLRRRHHDRPQQGFRHLRLAARGPRHGPGDLPLLDQPPGDRRQVGLHHLEDDGACGMTRRLASDRGQATVITVLFLTVLLGMAAMAIDVGTWYQAKRKLQAKAAARSDTISKARYAAPIAVDIKHPDLSGSGCPCFGQQTTLDLKKTGPGAFRLLNLDGSSGGINPHTLEEWMMSGFDGWMPVDKDYYSDPGAKFNSMQDALAARTGSELLFPIYDAVQGQGSNLTYHVIGWVGFHMTGYDARGSSGILYGWFTR